MHYVSFIWLTIILQFDRQLFRKLESLEDWVQGRESETDFSWSFGSVICIIPDKQMMTAMTNSYCDTALTVSSQQNGN